MEKSRRKTVQKVETMEDLSNNQKRKYHIVFFETLKEFLFEDKDNLKQYDDLEIIDMNKEFEK